MKNVVYCKFSKTWKHRVQINGKRVTTVLAKVDYGDGPIPLDPPEEAIRLIPVNSGEESVKVAVAPIAPEPQEPQSALATYTRKWLAEKNTGDPRKKNTERSRKNAVNHFLVYCEKAGLKELGEVRALAMKNFTNYLKGEVGLSPASARTCIGYVGVLFSDAIINEDYSSVNPTIAARKSNKVPVDTKRRHYNPEEYAIHMVAFRADVAAGLCEQWVLDAVVIESVAGLRVGACVAFECDWCDFEKNEINIPPEHSKTGRPYQAPLTPQVREIVERVGSGKILPRHATSTVSNHIKKVVERHNLPFITPNHAYRHTMATMAYRKGKKIEHISKALGHTSTAITEHYAKLVDGAVGEAFGDFVL